ncbi:MAG: protein-tyrosine-phosphatase [Candidatus Kapabacteria bacterium]|nr:protein-tyrosine-phosphatase [Ignavibacteriota bacterium]MCW5884239.1 protein-tyrosine-phosphatase [Candidatus Kapabacteria bacterium]
MNEFFVILFLGIMLGNVAMGSEILPELKKYADDSAGDINLIPSERQVQLDEIAAYLTNRVQQGKNIDMTFICTHNSRRSHISQLWAAVATEYYGIPNVRTYSGGTEATAFNHRSVRAMKKAGFSIDVLEDGKNPVYLCKFADGKEPLKAFSKVYDEKSNPQSDFIAVMVCSDADEACPFVSGAAERFSLPYDDPKNFDNTELEESKYDERTKQIATEILYLFSKVRNKVN